MQRGPVEVLFLAFPLGIGTEQMVNAIRQSVYDGAIRPIDVAFLLRAADGSVSPLEIDDPRWPHVDLADLELDPHTLLDDADLEVFAESLEQHQEGMAVVVEHAWARHVAGRLSEMGAEIALYARIPDVEVDLAYAAEQQLLS